MHQYLLASVVFIPSAAVSAAISGGYAGLQRYRPIALIGFLSGVVYLALVVAGASVGGIAAIWGAASGVLLRAILSVRLSWTPLLRHGFAAPRRELRSEATMIAHIAVPASIAAFAWMPVNSFLIAVIMASPDGRQEVAGFGVCLQIFTVVSVLPGVLTQFALPRLAASSSGNGTATRKALAFRYCVAAIGVTAPLAAGVAMTAPEALRLLGPEYVRFAPVLMLLMLSAALSAPQGILSNYLLATGQNWARVATWYGWASLVAALTLIAPEKSALTGAQAYAVGWLALLTSQGMLVAFHRRRSGRPSA